MRAKILMSAQTIPAGQVKGVLILTAVIDVSLLVPLDIDSTNLV
jgi:hypothetical protein